jgi:hypothetical protein
VQGNHRTRERQHNEYVWQTNAVALRPQKAGDEYGKQTTGKTTRQRYPHRPRADAAPAHETRPHRDTQQVTAGSTGNRAGEIAPAIGGATLTAEPPPELRAQKPEWQAQQEATYAFDSAKQQVVTHGRAAGIILWLHYSQSPLNPGGSGHS